MELNQEDWDTILQSASIPTELHLENLGTGRGGNLEVLLSALTDLHFKTNTLRSVSLQKS